MLSEGLIAVKNVPELIVTNAEGPPKSGVDKEIGTPNLGTNWILNLLTYKFTVQEVKTVVKKARVSITVKVGGIVIAEEEKTLAVEEEGLLIPFQGFIQFFSNPVIFGGQSLAVNISILETVEKPTVLGSSFRINTGSVTLSYTLNDNHPRGKIPLSVGGI